MPTTMSEFLGSLSFHLIGIEPQLRALVPWGTGGSRLFLWCSGLFVLLTLSAAGVKTASFALSSAAKLLPDR